MTTRRPLSNTASFCSLVAGLFVVTLIGYSVQSERHFGNIPVELAAAARTNPPEPAFVELAVGLGAPVQPARLKGPARLEAAWDDHFFSIDDGDGDLLRRHDSDGRIVEEYRGDDTPSIKSITDVGTTQASVIVADLLGSSLHRLDRRSGRWVTIRTEAEPYRAVPLSASLMAIMRINTEELFDIADENGVVSARFGRLLRNQRETALALDGFAEPSNGGLIYASKYIGTLASFSDQGDVRWLAATVKPPSPPSIAVHGNSRRVQHSSVLATVALAVSGAYVMTLAKRPQAFEWRAFVDIYSVDDGSYLHSVLLPLDDKWTGVATVGDHVFVAHRTGIARWPKSAFVHRVPEFGRWVVSVGSQDGRTS